MAKFFIKKNLVVVALLLVLGGPSPAFSQTETEARPAPTLRPISEEDWKKAAHDLDYSADQPDEPKPRRSPDFDFSPGPGFGLGRFSGALQAIFIALGVAVVAWMVYRFAAGPRSKNIKPGGLLDISPLDDSDSRLLDADLDRLLREAKTAGQWPLAVRLHYLLTIRELNTKNFITWRREKTNRDYLNELGPSGLAPGFRLATGIFERVWYGEEPLDAYRFAQIEPVFAQFLEKI